MGRGSLRERSWVKSSARAGWEEELWERLLKVRTVLETPKERVIWRAHLEKRESITN